MEAKALAQQTPRTGAQDRASDSAGGDHSYARTRFGWQKPPVCNQATGCQPLSFLADACEVAPLLDSRLTPKLQPLWRSPLHAGELNRRQALAPFSAAVAQDGPPAFARVAAQESVLAFAADFRGLVLSFHNQSVPGREVVPK